MPQSMDIQYPRANIKGDMSNFMKNSENFVTTVPLAVGYGALNLWVRSLDR